MKILIKLRPKYGIQLATTCVGPSHIFVDANGAFWDIFSLEMFKADNLLEYCKIKVIWMCL